MGSTLERERAWKFLTSNNYADIDVYLHNYINHDAFFAYRAINTEGAIQSSGDCKACYEIGTSLRVMASNYDLVSNYQSFHSDQPHNYLKEQIKQVKKEPKNKGFFGDGTKNIPKDWHPNQACTFLVTRNYGQNYEVQFRQILTSQIGMVYRKIPPITNGTTIEFEARPISTPDKTFQYINFRAEKEFRPSEGITLAFKNDGTISYLSGDEWHILRNYSQGELYHIKISNINLTEGQFNIEINGIIEEKNCPLAGSQRGINYVTIASTGNQPSTVINYDNLKIY